MSLFRRKPIETDLAKDTGLKRVLSAFDLTLLGVGAIIGAGIFVLTGRAAAVEAGPAITLAFVVAGIACTCAALAYAELASTVGRSEERRVGKERRCGWAAGPYSTDER